MKIVNSPELDNVLAEYVAGVLSTPARILIDSHLEMNDQSYQWVGDLESLAGMELDETEPTLLNDQDGMLASIFESSDESVTEPVEKPVHLGDARGDYLPAVLSQYLGMNADEIGWKTKIPGVRTHAIACDDDCEMYLLRIKPGMAMPTHSHGGREMTLVLTGGFQDGAGHYVRGDVAVAEEGDDHKPIADQGEDCICLIVNDAPLRFSNPIARIISSMLPN